jgi:hypothetical protein
MVNGQLHIIWGESSTRFSIDVEDVSQFVW